MTKVHRVAFAGASGTGKTTLSRWLASQYDLPFNPVGSRGVAQSMGFSSPYECDAAGKRAEFQTRLVEEKVAWEARHDIFVTDRTTLDNLAYSMLHDARGITTAYFELVCSGLERYDYIIYCPASVFIDLDQDPCRLSGMTYHHLYDAALWGLLQRFRPRDVRLVTMPFPALEHRKDFLRTLMKPDTE